MADMQIKGIDHLYLEERGIFIRLLQGTADFREALEKDPVYKAFFVIFYSSSTAYW